MWKTHPYIICENERGKIMNKEKMEAVRIAAEKVMTPYYDKIDSVLKEYHKTYESVCNKIYTEEVQEKINKYIEGNLKEVAIPIYLEENPSNGLTRFECIRLVVSITGHLYANGRILYAAKHIRRNFESSIFSRGNDEIEEMDNSSLAGIVYYMNELLRKTKILYEIDRTIDQCIKNIMLVCEKKTTFSFDEEASSSFTAIKNRCEDIESILSKIKSSDKEGK